jgi:hypothetical protein|tara:strand:+ start:191 stop:676 length:486 start_codon:yes stop_codon:yes gene_type:complete
MVSIKQMRSLIERTCSVMGDKFVSESAIDMVLATGIIESRYEYITQMNDGVAKSFFQVEPKTAVDNCMHYLKHRPELMKKCAEASVVDLKYWQNFDDKVWANILEKNIASGIVHCRLKYWRVPKRMPSSVEGMAHYWKDYYNAGGKGDPDEFIEQVTKWLR